MLKSIFSMLFIFFSIFAPQVQAEMKVIVIDPNILPYDLAPQKYDNSPLKYDNSASKYDNSVSKYDNSPSKYDNSPSKYENSSGKNRLITSEGKSVGYSVYSSDGVLNIFSRSGVRLGYVPAGSHTQSIFQSEGSSWCGSLGIYNNEPVVGLTKNCFYRLLADQ